MGRKSLQDLHLEDFDDTEIYNDAAVRQAQIDMMSDFSPELQEEMEAERYKRRSARFDNVKPREDSALDDKWSKYQI